MTQQPNTNEPIKPANQLTPLTDEQVLAWTTQDGSEIVHTDHARQLERELAEARAEARRSKSIELEVTDGRHVYLQHEMDEVDQRALALEVDRDQLRAKVADIQEAHDKIYAFALKTVEENEALEKRVAALEVELAKGLEMITAAHTNAAHKEKTWSGQGR
jgi:DNA-binding protein H-NS